MGSAKTTLNPQPWPWPGPRVLVEHRDEAAGLALASSLREAGYAVAVCPGPDKAERCPLAGRRSCVTTNNVIVSSLDLDRPEAREAVQALRARCPNTPLIVEVAPGKEAGWDFLAGCDLVVSPISRTGSWPPSIKRSPSVRASPGRHPTPSVAKSTLSSSCCSRSLLSRRSRSSLLGDTGRVFPSGLPSPPRQRSSISNDDPGGS